MSLTATAALTLQFVRLYTPEGSTQRRPALHTPTCGTARRTWLVLRDRADARPKPQTDQARTRARFSIAGPMLVASVDSAVCTWGSSRWSAAPRAGFRRHASVQAAMSGSAERAMRPDIPARAMGSIDATSPVKTTGGHSAF